jgi:hypothetical protein
LFALAWANGCGGSPPISRIEDKARLDVPIAICRKPLAPNETNDAGVARSDAYWNVLLPGFRGIGFPIRPGDVDCVGDRSDNGMAGPVGTVNPVAEDDLVLSAPEDGVQAAWLRAFRTADGTAFGPLGLVRGRASELDVYAVGRFRGSVRNSRFELGQLGTFKIVVAHDGRCVDAKVDVECESTVVFFVANGGKLVAAANTPEQRLRYANAKGLGRFQYRLTTDPPMFDGPTVRVHEKLLVRDANQEEVRKAEGDRVFTLAGEGRLTAQQDSLWSQLPSLSDR